MTIFFPVIYLFVGWLIGRGAWDVKSAASLLLTRLVIPAVIIFNISTRFGSMGTVIITTALTMLVMLTAGRYINRDPVMNLCFSYLNIGWLGLPVATALFGNDAATIIIAAYVGSSIVGNSVGAGMLSGNKFSLIKLLQTPPVVALVIGVLLIPFSQKITLWFDDIYEVAKFLMSFLGMVVLGIWLSKTRIILNDLRCEIRLFVQRACILFVLITLLLIIAHLAHQTLIMDNPATLYLFCLLPPAANIIVLETHYLGTGRSARPISCGTCISIVAIAFYAAVVLGYQLLSYPMVP